MGIFFTDNIFLDTSITNEANISNFNMLKSVRFLLREKEELMLEEIVSETGVVPNVLMSFSRSLEGLQFARFIFKTIFSKLNLV